jgi:hypothetical protein
VIVLHSPECFASVSHVVSKLEILRDYGFVEMMPQRWHYNRQFQFDIDEDEDGELTLMWHRRYKPLQDNVLATITYFKRQMRRLRHLQQFSWKKGKPDNITQYEWDTIWAFQEANVVAMSIAINSLKEEDDEESEKTEL